MLLTVNNSAAQCRPRNAKLVQKYKYAKSKSETDEAGGRYAGFTVGRDYLTITEWGVADVDGDTAQCGLSGSPTKVKKVENIIFQAKESRSMTGSDEDIESLIVELINNHTIG